MSQRIKEEVKQAAPNPVMFIGGELDGRVYMLPDLTPRCRVPYIRHKPNFWADPPPLDAPIEPHLDEYVLTRKAGAFYYVERDLLEMSNREGVDPRPELDAPPARQ